MLSPSPSIWNGEKEDMENIAFTQFQHIFPSALLPGISTRRRVSRLAIVTQEPRYCCEGETSELRQTDPRADKKIT